MDDYESDYEESDYEADFQQNFQSPAKEQVPVQPIYPKQPSLEQIPQPSNVKPPKPISTPTDPIDPPHPKPLSKIQSSPQISGHQLPNKKPSKPQTLRQVQQQNKQLRNKLKQLNNKLSDVLDLQKTKKRPKSSSLQDAAIRQQLRTHNKQLHIYQNQSHKLKVRLQKLTDPDYQSKLRAQISAKTEKTKEIQKKIKQLKTKQRGRGQNLSKLYYEGETPQTVRNANKAMSEYSLLKENIDKIEQKITQQQDRLEVLNEKEYELEGVLQDLQTQAGPIQQATKFSKAQSSIIQKSITLNRKLEVVIKKSDSNCQIYKVQEYSKKQELDQLLFNIEQVKKELAKRETALEEVNQELEVILGIASKKNMHGIVQQIRRKPGVSHSPARTPKGERQGSYSRIGLSSKEIRERARMEIEPKPPKPQKKQPEVFEQQYADQDLQSEPHVEMQEEIKQPEQQEVVKKKISGPKFDFKASGKKEVEVNGDLPGGDVRQDIGGFELPSNGLNQQNTNQAGNLDFLNEQPKKPSFIDKKPSEPSFIDKKPSEPSFIDKKPSEPSFIDKKPSQPSFIDKKPSQPSFLNQGPKRPSFLDKQPAQPSFLNQQPKQPSFLDKQPAQPSFLDQQPKRPSFLDNKPEPNFLNQQDKPPNFVENIGSKQVNPEQPAKHNSKPGFNFRSEEPFQNSDLSQNIQPPAGFMNAQQPKNVSKGGRDRTHLMGKEEIKPSVPSNQDFLRQFEPDKPSLNFNQPSSDRNEIPVKQPTRPYKEMPLELEEEDLLL